MATTKTKTLRGKWVMTTIMLNCSWQLWEPL